MKILVVDDEADIREILAFNLRAAGYDVSEAGTAEAALVAVKQGKVPDLFLLDVMLPGMSGFKFADVLRKELKHNTPIIFLTARNEENDMLTGFSAGGDDYISKPFSIYEVIARVKAVLRRSSKSSGIAPGEIVQAGPITIDPVSKNVKLNSEPLVLSKKEYDILYLLASNRGRTFSRTEIIAELWKEAPCVLERTVDVHIARIRSKLGEFHDLITNRAGFGYSIQ
ncbi:MAG: response regulator transcription factor [Candidatus Cryptobacteroides sp.]